MNPNVGLVSSWSMFVTGHELEALLIDRRIAALRVGSAAGVGTERPEADTRRTVDSSGSMV
jgi:hypothetical protein